MLIMGRYRVKYHAHIISFNPEETSMRWAVFLTKLKWLSNWGTEQLINLSIET